MDKGADLIINPVVIPPVQGPANEQGVALSVPSATMGPVQGPANEQGVALSVPSATMGPVRVSRNEQDSDFTIPLVELKEIQSGGQDEPLRPKMVPLNGKLITAEDPATIGTNFRTLINMRPADKSVKSIAGMTKINSANAMDATYFKTRNAFHFRKIQPAEATTVETHVLAQAWNTGLTAAHVLQNVTAPPAVGDFEATDVWTDTDTSTNPVKGLGT